MEEMQYFRITITKWEKNIKMNFMGFINKIE